MSATLLQDRQRPSIAAASASASVHEPARGANVLHRGWLFATALLCGVGGVVPLSQALDTLGTPQSFRHAALAQAVTAAAWYAASAWLARRWSLTESTPRALSGLGAIILGVTVAATLLLTAVVPIPSTYPVLTQRAEVFFGWLPTHAVTVGMLSLVQAWTDARVQRERAARRTALLNASLVEAQLDALRTRVAPHFLLNALNTVVALARTGQADRAADVAADLGALMQFTLTESGDAVAFDTECEVVERYLAIELARFGDRLRVEWWRDPASRSCRVPALVWQPLVENAIRHGLARRSAPGILRLDARCVGSGDTRVLVLVIEADGPDADGPDSDTPDADTPDADTPDADTPDADTPDADTPDADTPDADTPDADRPDAPTEFAMPLGGLGIGAATVQQRLRLLYGDAASLDVTRRADGGSRTELRLPAPLTREGV